MPLISTMISVSFHLIWAFLVNLVLKKYEVVADKEFMLVYFVLLALIWKSTIDKLWINLILNPITVSNELMIEGLKRRKKYVEKYQRKQSRKKTNSSSSRS